VVISPHPASRNKYQPLKQFIRKNLSTLFLILLLGVLLFNPNAKAFFLKAMLSTGFFNASTKKESKSVNAEMTALLFTDKNGTRINTTDLKGKVIFINFWATWCPPCIAEMGSVNALYNKLKNDPRFVFIIADTDNNLQHSGAFMNKHQYDLPVYQVAGPVSPDLFNGTLPTTLIIDSKGNLIQKHEGIANYDTKAMVEFLQSLLQ
jgi:thiol-disulfide isomerase/thioredoxin